LISRICLFSCFLIAGLAVVSGSALAGNAAIAQNGPVVQPAYTCTTNIYVDAINGSDTGNAGTSSAYPFKTIAKATAGNGTLAAGTCVNVAPGIYPETVWLPYGGNTNAPTGYVVLRACRQLSQMSAQTRWMAAKKVLASLS
jgi:hypothetical protein